MNFDELKMYCDSLDEQYDNAKLNGLFDVLLLVDLDSKNSDKDLSRAINHFKSKNGNIGKEAPIEFLSPEEVSLIFKNGDFRYKLYSMLLSIKFSEGIENKTIFLSHSYKYSFKD